MSQNQSSTPPPSPYDLGPTPPPSPFGSNPTPPSNPAPNSTPHDSAPEPALPWYAKPWATVVSLVVFPLQPAGIYLMWKYRTWQRGPKVLATIVSLLFFSSLLPKSPDKTATQTATRTASNAPTSNAPAAAKTSAAPKATKSAASGNSAAKPSQKTPRKATPVEEPDETQSDVSTADSQLKPDQAPREADRQNVEEMDIEGVGKREVGMVDDVFYVVLKVEKTPAIGNGFSDQRADGQFYILTLRAHNNAKQTHDVNTQVMQLLDDQDREFDPSSQGLLALAGSGEDSAQIIAQVQPGTTKTLTLVYDAPDDASGLCLKIPGGFLSASGDAVLKLPKESS